MDVLRVRSTGFYRISYGIDTGIAVSNTYVEFHLRACRRIDCQIAEITILRFSEFRDSILGNGQFI